MEFIVFTKYIGSVNSSGSSKRSENRGCSAAPYACAVTWEAAGWAHSAPMYGTHRKISRCTGPQVHSPHVRKGFPGARQLLELPTHTAASGVEVAPWNTVWTTAVWVLVMLPVGRLRGCQHLGSEQTLICSQPEPLSGRLWHGAPFI